MTSKQEYYRPFGKTPRISISLTVNLGRTLPESRLWFYHFPTCCHDGMIVFNGGESVYVHEANCQRVLFELRGYLTDITYRC